MQYRKHQLFMEKPAHFFILVTMLSLSSTTICSLLNKATDQESLIAFKSSIISGPYEILTKNWSANASICSWMGVSCSLNHQRVTALNFLGFSFKGTIPPAIGNLTFLTSLDLSYNNFTGFIPNELSNLSRLQVLNFSCNSLTGEIPYGIFNLSSIEEVHLTANNLQGGLPKDICNGISRLSGLYLSENILSGQIPFDIYKCSELVDLCVESNHFNGSLPSSIGWLNKLQRLYVGANSFQVIIVVIVILVLMRRRKRTKELPNSKLSPVHPWRESSYMELARATNDFRDNNKLGSGGAGTVFIGTLFDGLIVAIKVFNQQFEKISRSFDTEVQVLRTIHHRNSIKVIGCCCNQDFKALVLEYMPNGSLDKWLHSHNHFLDLLQRMNIAIDIALALEYLHLRHTFPIVHCDWKPSNVFLDKDITAHVGDFGIAKLLGEEETVVHTRTLATITYMALEYGAHGMVSTSGDIYSFE